MRFATDENFDNDILRSLSRRYPTLDVMRIQDAGLSGADDPTILEWAAQQGRILLTHDGRTMPNYAYARVAAGLPMPGVFEISDTAPIGKVIETLVLIIEASIPDDWKDKVTYIPFGLSAGLN